MSGDRIAGTDARFAEITVERCPLCAQRWLHYLIEEEGISRSGRWYRGALRSAEVVTVDNAEHILASLDWHWAGGSYFDGAIVRRSGAIR